MSVNSKMTAIADEIRSKTGLSDELTLEQMAIDIAAIPTQPVNVPDYVMQEAERVADAVKSIQNSNTISFIALADIHAQPDYQDSILHMAQAANIIKGKIPIDFTAVLGDVVYGASTDTYDEHMKNLLTSARILSIANPDIRLDGNHDSNIYVADISLAPSELHRYTCRFNNPNVVAGDTERGYFHYDMEDSKIRVICVNSADLKDISPSSPQDGHHVSAEQLAWLASILDMTGFDEWGVIVLAHHPIHWDGAMENVLTMLDAYVAGTSGSVTADGQIVSYDFSGKNAAKLIATFHGHTHNLIYGKSGTSEIIRFCTPNACYDRNNEYGNATEYPDATFRGKYGETTTYAKTKNSKNDTAFVVYTIDTAAEVIYATCYGAGYDRVMSYADVVYYSITNILNNVTTSNTAPAIEQGGAYTANLTAADGYELDSVTVTMGGEDITAECVTDGKIQIDSVTGDVVITANAAVGNLVKSSIDTSGAIYNGIGYKTDTRLSSSGGESTSSAPGCIVCGYIPVKAGDIVRIYGSTNTNHNASGNYCNGYGGSNFNFLSYLAPTDAAGNKGIWSVANGKVLWTIDTALFPTMPAYIRVSLASCAADDFLITINQEIT